MTRLRFLDAPAHTDSRVSLCGLWTALLVVSTAPVAIFVVPATIEMRRATVDLREAREALGDVQAARREAAELRAEVRQYFTAAATKAKKLEDKP